MDARNTIPWSQQVDEDLYENSSSFITTDNRPGTKSRHQTFERVDYMRRNDNYNSGDKVRPQNVVSSSLSNTSKKDNFNYFRKMSSEENHQKPYFGSSDRKPIDSSLSPDKNASAAASAAAMASLNNKKKITWASIASQPAKPNKRNNIALKKKGPGMPPPPMIPGKHALNVNPWDYSRSSFSNESDFIPVNESETVPHPQPEPQPQPQPQPQDLNQQQSEPGDNSSTKWKVQHPEQHSDFSRKLNQQSSNTNIQNTITYNKPINNKNDRRDYSNSDEIVPERSIVPRHQYHDEESQNMNRQQQQGNFGRMHNYNAARRPGPGMGPGTGSQSNMFAKPGDCPQPQQPNTQDCSEIVLKQLKDRNNYNPVEIDMQNANLARYFVIKSYSEDDIHRSIKYEIWCSTDHGNKKLDDAFKERMKVGGNVMLYFSVNGSGHFCGMAQMMTPVDYKSTASVWSQDKWKGKFKVKWTYVKDVPNSQLRHIRLENNENKSVTNSRDTQEIPLNQGLQILKIFHSFKHLTSIFDDFYHYEKKQEESVSSKKPTHFDGPNQNQSHGHSLSSSSSNAYYGDNNKELNNDWHTSSTGGGNLKERGNFRMDRGGDRSERGDRTDRADRSDQQQHYYANRNRKNNGKPIIMDIKRNIDAQEKSLTYNKGQNKQQQQQQQQQLQPQQQQDNEDNTNTKQQPQQHHNILEKHSNPSIENSSSGSFNCNDNSNSNSNSIIRDDIHTK